MKKIIAVAALVLCGGVYAYAAEGCDCACGGKGSMPDRAPEMMMGPGPGGHSEGKMGRHGGPEKMEEMFKDIGLSEEQQKKIKELSENRDSGKDGLKDEMKAKMEALKTEMEKENFDEAAARKAHAELSALMNKAGDARFEHVIALRKVLTAEQFKKMHSKMMGGFGKHEKKDGDWKGKKGKDKKVNKETAK